METPVLIRRTFDCRFKDDRGEPDLGKRTRHAELTLRRFVRRGGSENVGT